MIDIPDNVILRIARHAALLDLEAQSPCATVSTLKLSNVPDDFSSRNDEKREEEDSRDLPATLSQEQQQQQQEHQQEQQQEQQQLGRAYDASDGASTSKPRGVNTLASLRLTCTRIARLVSDPCRDAAEATAAAKAAAREGRTCDLVQLIGSFPWRDPVPRSGMQECLVAACESGSAECCALLLSIGDMSFQRTHFARDRRVDDQRGALAPLGTSFHAGGKYAGPAIRVPGCRVSRGNSRPGELVRSSVSSPSLPSPAQMVSRAKRARTSSSAVTAQFHPQTTISRILTQLEVSNRSAFNLLVFRCARAGKHWPREHLDVNHNEGAALLAACRGRHTECALLLLSVQGSAPSRNYSYMQTATRSTVSLGESGGSDGGDDGEEAAAARTAAIESAEGTESPQQQPLAARRHGRGASRDEPVEREMADVSVRDHCPLRIACENGDHVLVSALLMRGASASSDGELAIRTAVRAGHVKCVEALVASDPEIVRAVTTGDLDAARRVPAGSSAVRCIVETRWKLPVTTAAS